MSLSFLKSKWVIIAYLLIHELRSKWRVQSRQFESDYGSTHRNFSLGESLKYIDEVFNDYLHYSSLKTEDLIGKRILEIGPGDNLGVAFRFLAAGAERVVCLDRFYCERDPESEKQIYRALRQSLSIEEQYRVDKVLNADESSIRSDKLIYLYGKGIEEVSEDFEASSFDVIVSRAVLEHLYDLDLAFDAMTRLLSPGGLLIHKIDFRDHGLFSGCGLHPLTFLTVPEFFYSRMHQFSGNPNRKLLGYFLNKMKELPYEAKFFVTQVLGETFLNPHPSLDAFSTDLKESKAMLDRIRPKLMSPFREMEDRELLIAGIFLIARKIG